MKSKLIIFVALFGAVMACQNTEQPTCCAFKDPIPLLARMVDFDSVYTSDTTLKMPESIIFNPQKNEHYISNINQGPRDKDGNGSIAVLDINGKITATHLEGQLNSPKGMGIYKDLLYVADIDEVVVINVNTWKIEQKYQIDNVGMLNDIAVDVNGVVWITDMDGCQVFQINEGKIRLWKNEGLYKPNGILVEKDRVLIASFAEGTLTAYDLYGDEISVLAEGLGMADGIVALERGEAYLVSDWNGTVFLCEEGFAPQAVYQSKTAGCKTADIGLGKVGEATILIPTFHANTIIGLAYKKHK